MCLLYNHADNTDNMLYTIPLQKWGK